MAIETLRIMCNAWKYGDKMIPFVSSYSFGAIDPDCAVLTRALAANEAFSFIRCHSNKDQLKAATVEDMLKEDVRILTKVLPTVSLINTFEKVATKSKNNMNMLLRWIPGLQIEDLATEEFLESYPEERDNYKDNWKNLVKELCQQARGEITQPTVARKKQHSSSGIVM